MLDRIARGLSDPANILILACLTGAAVSLALHYLVTVRRWRHRSRRGWG
jgi:hypothetical protein